MAAVSSALRVFVQSGGCSGLSYGLGLDEACVTTMPCMRCTVSRWSSILRVLRTLRFLIDYKEALRGGGFAITNPNVVRTCGGCSSFRTAEHAGAAEPC